MAKKAWGKNAASKLTNQDKHKAVIGRRLQFKQYHCKGGKMALGGDEGTARNPRKEKKAVNLSPAGIHSLDRTMLLVAQRISKRAAEDGDAAAVKCWKEKKSIPVQFRGPRFNLLSKREWSLLWGEHTSDK